MQQFKTKPLLDSISLFLTCTLIAMLAFHFQFSSLKYVLLYRELFAVFFIMITLMYVVSIRNDFVYKVSSEGIIFFLSIILIINSAAYDQGYDIYNFGDTLSSITNADVDPRLYVLRNVLIYIPLVLMFAVRGATSKDIRIISIISILVAPFSIIFYLQYALQSGNLGLFVLGEMAETGGANIEYNSYVPYLMFPILSGCYLLLSKTNILLKILTILSMGIITTFVFLSSSRQTLLFFIITFITFFLFSNVSLPKKIFTSSFTIIFLVLSFFFITAGNEIDEGLSQKYSGGETSRFEIMLDGIERLKTHQLFLGAGLTSVIVSGPHNDYIRWTQRVGIILMLLYFLPFFIASWKTFRKVIDDEKNMDTIFILVGLLYVLYNSLFGYPREDAYQALYCYLIFGIYFGYQRQSLKVL